jgi:hypothetical protein
MPTIPRKLAERGLGREHARKINEVIEYVRSLRPIATPNEEVEHTVHGVARRPKGGGGIDESSIVPRWL